MSEVYDVIVVGGGIIGLSAAWHLQQALPECEIAVLEKEPRIGAHQTSHNSGVIHAGLYYPPDSLKARFCRAGLQRTYAFCAEHGLPVRRCGKAIVAADDAELARLRALFERASANGAELQWWDRARLREAMPAVAGSAALFSPATGAVDFHAVAARLAELFVAGGGRIVTGAQVTDWTEVPAGIAVEASRLRYAARYVICCAGLYADRLATLAGLHPEFRIVPFRGEYFELPQRWREAIPHHVYPVPDPGLPFLGVHLTRTADDRVLVGPNAVFALGREAYRRSMFDARELAAALAWPGTWRMLLRHRAAARAELRSSRSREAYAARVRRYVPNLRTDELVPAPAGVRAQAVGIDGTLINDFLILQTARSLHVCNAPSPAATAALPIGAHIAELMVPRINKPLSSATRRLQNRVGLR